MGQAFGFFYPACDGQVVNAKGALQTADAGALQVGAENLLTNFLRVRLLWVETAVASASLALVFLLPRAGEPIAFELVAATIGGQMFDFFNDYEFDSSLPVAKVGLNHYKKIRNKHRNSDNDRTHSAD